MNALHEGILISQHDHKAVYRCQGKRESSYIAKLWKLRKRHDHLRRWLGISSAKNEWKWLNILTDRGIRVPKPIAYQKLPKSYLPYREAVFMEDLGECKEALKHIKLLIREGLPQELFHFEEQLIRMTVSMIQQNFLDSDHSLVNCVVRSNGELVRIDFEITKKVFHRDWRPQLYAEMLGNLLASYTYAAQPALDQVIHFARRLHQSISPTPKLWELTQRDLHRRLQVQKELYGIDTFLDLP